MIATSGQPQFLIETDIFAEFLFAEPGTRTTLTELLARGRCYTTFVNALELFRAARSPRAEAIIHDLLTMVRVLGLHARHAQPFAALAESVHTPTRIRLSDRDATIVGLAIASKLSIATKQKFELYSSLAIEGLQVTPIVDVATNNRRHSAANGSQNILSRVGIVKHEGAVREAFPNTDSKGD